MISEILPKPTVITIMTFVILTTIIVTTTYLPPPHVSHHTKLLASSALLWFTQRPVRQVLLSIPFSQMEIESQDMQAVVLNEPCWKDLDRDEPALSRINPVLVSSELLNLILCLTLAMSVRNFWILWLFGLLVILLVD